MHLRAFVLWILAGAILIASCKSSATGGVGDTGGMPVCGTGGAAACFRYCCTCQCGSDPTDLQTVYEACPTEGSPCQPTVSGGGMGGGGGAGGGAEAPTYTKCSGGCSAACGDC
jgi:hypothetical protein